MSEKVRRVIAECRQIAAMTEEPGRITRRFLSLPMREVHAHLRNRMESMGMDVRLDGVGNLRGLWRPSGASGKRLVMGSHIDTVPDAGAFDGVLGVVIALEWARIAQDLKLPLSIEVIAFSEEEGVRFGIPFIGSRAVAGRFDQTLLDSEDSDGISLGAAIRAFGLDPTKIDEAGLDPAAMGFVEIHIERAQCWNPKD
jgi:allantoate deiminase